MSTQIYIGELTRSVSPKYLEREFAKFGKITNFSFKGRFAFIDYEDAKDAEKAVDRMHNERFEDAKLVVEFASKSKCLLIFIRETISRRQR
jgi:arginine/serine-rich splicing factor 7